MRRTLSRGRPRRPHHMSHDTNHRTCPWRAPDQTRLTRGRRCRPSPRRTKALDVPRSSFFMLQSVTGCLRPYSKFRKQGDTNFLNQTSAARKDFDGFGSCSLTLPAPWGQNPLVPSSDRTSPRYCSRDLSYELPVTPTGFVSWVDGDVVKLKPLTSKEI